MSTRSVVAARTESGIKGVYVHSDGYPEGRLPVLSALIARDGTSKVVSTILAQPNGWSYLDQAAPGEVQHQMYNDGRFVPRAGYGLEYAPHPIQGDAEYHVPQDQTEDEVFIEYWYIINEDGSIDWADSCGVAFDDLQWEHVEYVPSATGNGDQTERDMVRDIASQLAQVGWDDPSTQ